MSTAKIIHITGIVCGFAASAITIGVGAYWASTSEADPMPPGQLITFGIAALISTIIAVMDGARAFPKLGIWKVGGKFEGLTDLATLLIFLIMAAGIGIGFAFK
jgi:hypothetical protein